MSRSVLDPVLELFRPPRPKWSCEFTARHVIAAGVDSSNKRIAGSAAAPLPEKALIGSLSEKNIRMPDVLAEVTREALRQAAVRGFEISVVIPDDSSRIAFLTTDSPTGKTEEREAFVRWKLKKSVPFDVDAAQMSYRILGPAIGESSGVDMIVALSPRSIVLEYEELLERLGYHAGYVVPSTLAAMNLYPGATSSATEDTLVVKLAPESITTTVFQGRRPRFYRRVGLMPLYDAVYPTVMYYQDKLGGTTLSAVSVCGYDSDPRTEIEDLQERLGVPVRRMEPKSVDDIYKPALGAVDLVWANSI